MNKPSRWIVIVTVIILDALAAILGVVMLDVPVAVKWNPNNSQHCAPKPRVIALGFIALCCVATSLWFAGRFCENVSEEDAANERKRNHRNYVVLVASGTGIVGAILIGIGDFRYKTNSATNSCVISHRSAIVYSGALLCVSHAAIMVFAIPCIGEDNQAPAVDL